MGIRYNTKRKKKVSTGGIITLSVVAILLLMLILPLPKIISTTMYGVFGLIIYFYLALGALVGLALLSGKKFYMSTKNIVYLTLSCFFVTILFHTIFLGSYIKSCSSVSMQEYLSVLTKTISGEVGLTIGGVIYSVFAYPFISLLGVVGASITFAIVATIFIGLTIDYYINLKSFYDKARLRRVDYQRNGRVGFPASDSIEGSVAGINTQVETLPKRVEKEELNNYNNQPVESSIDEYPIISETDEGETELVNGREESEEDYSTSIFDDNNSFSSKRGEDDSYEDERMTTRKYDPTKFKSPLEYIRTPLKPVFNNYNSDIEEEPLNSNLNESTEEEDVEDYSQSNGAFVFNPIESNFDSNEKFDKEDEYCEEDETKSPIKDSMFNKYAGDTFNLRTSFDEDRQPLRTEKTEPIVATGGFVLSPRQEPTQIEIPGVIKKPQKYQQEQDERYEAPTTQLLERREDDSSKYGNDYEEKSRTLENCLSSFKIDAKVSGVVRGPSVTQYQLSMPFGVSVKRVLPYDGDIAAALMSKKGIRIEAPIAGKNAVGVEVPNDERCTVGLRELLESNEFKNSKVVLPFVVGKNIYGQTMIKSMPKMVHMLVAGSTGSGKSVFLHSLIVSLMYKCSPSQVRFILIDPKRVEFTFYSGMPHMMLPNTISDCEKAINALSWAVKEMDRRYETFRSMEVQNIEGYNHCPEVMNGSKPKFFYVVIIIDEFNELMVRSKKEVEEKITRLSQLGRASGIHCVIATQRPSVDVITGTIKNNLPTRIAFSLQSGTDSRVILDEMGAEKLLGNGDMLFVAPYDDNVASRVQGAFISTDEIKKVIRYIKDHNTCYFDKEIENEIMADKKPQEVPAGSNIAANLEPDEDELLPVALKLCIQTGGASINMIQRRYKVGYARAARIIDQMEQAGYISPGNGSKLRTVYMSLDEYHEKFGEDD